jgi:hypothetical protein
MAVARHPVARIAPPAPAIISASRAYLVAPTARAPSLSEKEIGAGTRRCRSARRTSERVRDKEPPYSLPVLLRPPLAELDPIPERGRPRRRSQTLNMKFGAPLGGQPPRDKEYESQTRSIPNLGWQPSSFRSGLRFYR